MAFVSWEQPMKWIDVKEDDILEIVPETAHRLVEIKQAVAVIAMVGMYAESKSYLLNWLAGKQGFEVGRSKSTPHTKGIWVWCIQHPREPERVLIIVDTEGWGNPENTKTREERIFCLAVLLSTQCFLNLPEPEFPREITSSEIKKYVERVGDVTRLIKVTRDEYEWNANDFNQYFPKFKWIVRFFYRNTTEDSMPCLQYYQSMVNTVTNNTDSFISFCGTLIPNIMGEMFCMPVAKALVSDLAWNQLTEKDMTPDARRNHNYFREYSLKHETSKQWKNGDAVTGRILNMLAEEYVNILNAGNIICIEPIFKIVAEKAYKFNVQVEELINMFTSCLPELKYPVSDKQFNSKHKTASSPATNYFKSNEDKTFSQKFPERLSQNAEAKKNAEASTAKCKQIIDELYKSLIGEKLSNPIYANSSGSQLLQADLTHFLEEYSKIPEKGIKANEVLLEFLTDRGLEPPEMVLSSQMEETDNEVEDCSFQTHLLNLLDTAEEIDEIKTYSEILSVNTERETDVKYLTNENVEFEKKFEDKIKQLDKKIEFLIAQKGDFVDSKTFAEQSKENEAKFKTLTKQITELKQQNNFLQSQLMVSTVDGCKKNVVAATEKITAAAHQFSSLSKTLEKISF